MLSMINLRQVVLKDNRPINLDLTKFKFPLAAIASIFHRISGVLLFLLLPVMLWLLDQSLRSADHFLVLKALITQNLWMKLLIWGLISCMFYHLVAGIRHLLMDLGFWATTRLAYVTTLVMLSVFLVLAVLTGVWLW